MGDYDSLDIGGSSLSKVISQPFCGENLESIRRAKNDVYHESIHLYRECTEYSKTCQILPYCEGNGFAALALLPYAAM